MISTKPAVGRHFFRRFEFKGEKRRRSQAFYTGTSCLMKKKSYPAKVRAKKSVNISYTKEYPAKIRLGGVGKYRV